MRAHGLDWHTAGASTVSNILVHIPHIAKVLDTSNMLQDDIGKSLLSQIREAVENGARHRKRMEKKKRLKRPASSQTPGRIQTVDPP